MRIVIFIDWFAPAYKAGGPIQSIVNLVNQPLNRVEYRVVCSNKDLNGEVLAVQTDQWLAFNSNTKVWYLSNNKSMFSVLRDAEVKNADRFFINGIYSLYYNFLPLVLGWADKKIISARGMLHAGALSQKAKKKIYYLRLWRLLKLHRRNSFHATNSYEEKFIRAAFGLDTVVHVAQNLPRLLQQPSMPLKQKGVLELLSIGLISPMKNYLEVLQALQTCEARINYVIYGPVKDAPYWQQCKAVIDRLPQNITVNYAGDLPSAMIPQALAKAHVFVLPSKSENFGHAIYEALTAGRPVITSHFTPWNELEQAKAGRNVSLENDYELSKAICFFAAAGDEELSAWSAGAAAYAGKAIDIGAIKEQYIRMFTA